MNNWFTQIDKNTELFSNLLIGISNDQINWKLDDKTWSIAQNIDHIIKTNESYFPILQEAKKGSNKLPFIAKFNFLVNILGKFLLKAVQADRKMKMKTFSIWEPDNINSNDILEKFKKHQSELKKQIESSKDLIEKNTVISSPASKFIVYKLETAFDIIVTHEQRHLEQIREIVSLNKTKN